MHGIHDGLQEKVAGHSFSYHSPLHVHHRDQHGVDLSIRNAAPQRFYVDLARHGLGWIGGPPVSGANLGKSAAHNCPAALVERVSRMVSIPVFDAKVDWSEKLTA